MKAVYSFRKFGKKKGNRWCLRGYRRSKERSLNYTYFGGIGACLETEKKQERI